MAASLTQVLLQYDEIARKDDPVFVLRVVNLAMLALFAVAAGSLPRSPVSSPWTKPGREPIHLAGVCGRIRTAASGVGRYFRVDPLVGGYGLVHDDNEILGSLGLAVNDGFC